MGLFSPPQTIILKEGSSAQQQLAALESLRGTLPPAAERQLEADIRNVQAGIAGENRIVYELKNSHMDMFVLQDLFLEHEGLTAQIDFLVLTPQRYFVLECKNLYGNIEVNSNGDFIRHLGGGRKEGMYSPIAQNRRHIELIHAMIRDSHSFMTNLLINKDLNDIYRPLVVFANPKSVLNDRYAKKDVKKCLVRADRLIDTMRTINEEAGLGREKTFKSTLRQNAEGFLSKHKENPVDYTAKYRELAKTSSDLSGPSAMPAGPIPANGGAADATAHGVQTVPQAIMCPKCGATMVLRTARQGPRAGKQFYGCSRFPACHGIVNVGE